jgi:mitochondrial fission protein ELM1
MDSGLLDSLTPLPRPDAEKPVKVWLLLSKYGGDNAQVRALGDHLARRLGWSCVPKQVRFHPADKVVRERLPAAIAFDKSDSLAAPFPDVVVSCSRFYGMVGAWLKQQSAKSTGRPMVHVHLGRIAAPMSSFDLVAATPQYGLPAAPNFMPLALPFVPQDAAGAEAAIAAWAPQLDRLPRPWTVLLAGGPIPLIRFDEADADRIADRAIASARTSGGSLILVVSRRTPGPMRHRIAARIEAAADLPTWRVGWPAPEPNPYPALLALGDRFVVSCDSASMIADACISGKPVEVVRLPIADFVTRLSSRGLGLSLDARRRRRGRAGRNRDALDWLRDFLVVRHWMRPWDEMRDFLHGLETHGLLDPAAGDRARRIQVAELDALVARIAKRVAATKPAAAPQLDAVPAPELA